MLKCSTQNGHGFEDKIATLFRVLGFDVTVRQTIAAREVDLVCRRLDLPIPITYLIECKTGKVTAEHVDQFHSRVASIRAQEKSYLTAVPILVSEQEPVGHARENASGLGITFLTLGSLIRWIIPVDAYLHSIDLMAEATHIIQQNVPLRGRTETGEEGLLDALIAEWIRTPHACHLALLGDYGTGKTWTCLRLAKSLGDEFRADSSKPLPLLLSFKSYREGSDLRTLLLQELESQTPPAERVA